MPRPFTCWREKIQDSEHDAFTRKGIFGEVLGLVVTPRALRTTVTALVSHQLADMGIELHLGEAVEYLVVNNREKVGCWKVVPVSMYGGEGMMRSVMRGWWRRGGRR